MKTCLKCLIALVLGISLATPLRADTYIYSGELNVGDPVFNRAETLSGLSWNGTSVYFEALTFSLSVSDTVSMFMASSTLPDDDGHFSLYAGSFDPNSPLTNLVAVNDDYSSYRPGFSFLSLTGGIDYILVTSSWGNGATGTFTNQITSTVATIEAGGSGSPGDPPGTVYWQGASDANWSGANWTSDAAGTTPTAPPAADDVVFSVNSGAANQGATVLDDDFTIKTLTVRNSSAVGITGSHTLTINGASGTGITVEDGSHLTITADVAFAGATDTINVQNTGSASISGALSGDNDLIKKGDGTLILKGINTYTGDTKITGGTFEVDGGSSSNSSLFYVGEGLFGDGKLVIKNNGSVESSSGILGHGSMAEGTATVESGGSWTNTSTTYVGFQGTGSLEVKSGGTVTNAEGQLGYYSTATGVATVSGEGSLWDSTYQLTVGQQGQGVLNILEGGTVRVLDGYGQLTLAGGDDSSGTLNIGNGGAAGRVEAASIFGGNGTAAINFNHTGTFALNSNLMGSLSVTKLGSGTTQFAYTNFYSGNTIVKEGILELLLGGSIYQGSSDTVVGDTTGDDGTLLIKTYATVSAANGVLGREVGSTGRATVTGTWENANSLIIGDEGTGTLTLGAGGIVTVTSGTGTIELGSAGTGTGTLNIGNGGAVGILNAARVNGGAGTSYLNFNHTNSAYNFGAAITGNVSVSHAAGSTTLSGENTYTGNTSITGGTVKTASQSALGTGSVNLSGGSLAPVARLDINNLTWSGGTIASVLGATTGSVNITTDLTLTGPGQFEFSLGTGFAGDTSYAILTATNLDSFTIDDFSAGAIGSLNPTFRIENDTLFVTFAGATTGFVLQNGAPVFTSTSSDFLINGSVSTGGPTDSNTIGGLTFTPGSQLQVFNNLTVTSGNFTTASGAATITGGNVIVPGNFNKWGGGLLNLLTNVFVNNNAFINAGILSVNSNFMAQNLFVQLNSILKGSSTIFGNVFNNGTVAPGNSPGTLTVNGSFTQSSSGSLEIEIASPTNLDQLIVTGQASLAGALQVVSFNGYQFQFGEQFAFLQAGSIIGNFDSITVSDPSIFRGRFLVDGGTGSVVIAPASYTLVAQTTNQQNVARALNSYIPATSGDRLAVSTALDLLTAQEYPAAFEQIAPTYHESLGNITIEQAFVQTQQIYQRLSAVRLGANGFQSIGMDSVLMHDKDGKSVLDAKDAKKTIEQTVTATNWSLWTMGTGLFGRVTNVSQVPNYNFNTGGFLVGGDYRWSENFVSGLFGGYQYTWADAGDAGNTQINSALFGGYASYTKGGFTADTVVSGGYNGYRVRRGIDFGTIDRLAKSQPNGGQFSAALNLGYDWQLGKFTLGPIAGVQYSYAGISGFTENGANSLDLAVGQQNVNSLRTTFGGRIAYTWNVTDKIALIPEARMFWQHEFLNNPRNISSALDGGSGPTFGYETSAPARDSVFAGAGLSAQFGERWTPIFTTTSISAGRIILAMSFRVG